MTIAELKTRIEQRGFTVEAINSTGDKHELVVKGKDGSRVPWPMIETGKSGSINGVAIRSYHPPKVDGQNEHATVAIYGDLYAQHNGRPSAADKSVAAMFAKPAEAAQPEQKTEVPAAVVEQAKAPESEKQEHGKGKKSSRQAA